MYVHRIFLGTAVAMGIVVTALPASAAGLFGLHDHGTWFGAPILVGSGYRSEGHRHRHGRHGHWRHDWVPAWPTAWAGQGVPDPLHAGASSRRAGMARAPGVATPETPGAAAARAPSERRLGGGGRHRAGRAGRDALSQPVRGWWQRYRLLRSPWCAIPQSRSLLTATSKPGDSPSPRCRRQQRGHLDKPREPGRQRER